jgi:hypothetical protein
MIQTTHVAHMFNCMNGEDTSTFHNLQFSSFSINWLVQDAYWQQAYYEILGVHFPYYPGDVPFPFMSKNLTEDHIFSTWINEETTVNSPNDSLISILPLTDSCEMTKCFALVLLFKFTSMKNENVTNFFCYRGHGPQYYHKHFKRQ